MKDLLNRLQHPYLIDVVKTMVDKTNVLFYKKGNAVYIAHFVEDDTVLIVDTLSCSVSAKEATNWRTFYQPLTKSNKSDFISVLAQVCEIYLQMINRKNK